MATRVLVVDDYAPWRRFIFEVLEQAPDLEIVAEASDGLAAVQMAQESQPDLILLDIGLPGLTGLEAACRIRTCSPQSKILIVSEQCELDIVQKALQVGSHGYLVKSLAGQQLLPALSAVLAGKPFVSFSPEPETMQASLGGL